MSNVQVRQQEIGGLISKRASMINALFKNEDDAKRFRAVAVAVASNKNLADCSNDSIIGCIMGIAQLRLSIDPNIGHCYVVPYQVKDKKDKSKVLYTVAQMQLGYKGFIQLLYRAGWFIKAYPIYSVDKFEMEFDNETMQMKFNYVPNYDSQEDDDNNWVYQNLRGVFVVSKDERGNVATEFVSKSKIEKIRMKSENQKSKDAPDYIWKDYYEEMAKKTAIKKVAKTLAYGDERVGLAIVADDKMEAGKVINAEKTFQDGVLIEAEAQVEEKPKVTQKATGLDSLIDIKEDNNTIEIEFEKDGE